MKVTSAAKDRALDYVKSQVLTGAFPGGELISEGEVATALGMSRTPVREAFLQLEAAGLLRLYPKRGALVVPVSPDEVRAVLDARLLMEDFAAGAVIQRGPGVCTAVFEQLSAQLQRQREAARQCNWPTFSTPIAPFTRSLSTPRAIPSSRGSTRHCAIARCG